MFAILSKNLSLRLSKKEYNDNSNDWSNARDIVPFRYYKNVSVYLDVWFNENNTHSEIHITISILFIMQRLVVC